MSTSSSSFPWSQDSETSSFRGWCAAKEDMSRPLQNRGYGHFPSIRSGTSSQWSCILCIPLNLQLSHGLLIFPTQISYPRKREWYASVFLARNGPRKPHFLPWSMAYISFFRIPTQTIHTQNPSAFQQQRCASPMDFQNGCGSSRFGIKYGE